MSWDSETFAQEFESIGPGAMSAEHNIDLRWIYTKRRKVEVELGRSLSPPGKRGETNRSMQALQEVGFEAKEMINLDIQDGIVLVGSDCHYWPGMRSTAHAGFVKMCKELKPKAVIMNGDVLDGSTISRFPPPGWEYQPDLIDELDACFDSLREIEEAAPRARHIWTYGNHDQRFELKLAQLTKEYRGLPGFHLHDHFQKWERCWGTFINHKAGSTYGVVVKHRIRSGEHAPFNNIKAAGISAVTGHLHSAKVYPLSTYHNNIFWGVDTGTLAEPRGRQFSGYTEAGPVNWRSSFSVLTFVKGRLLQPELCLTWEKGVMNFRGELIKVQDEPRATKRRSSNRKTARKTG